MRAPTLALDLPGSVTPTSYAPPSDLSFETWCSIVERLLPASQALQWWAGDLLLYGAHHYRGALLEVVKLTGLSRDTILDYVRIAREVKYRRADVSYSHHRVVATLSPEDQRKWLDKAAEQKLSVKDLKALIGAAFAIDYFWLRDLLGCADAAKALVADAGLQGISVDALLRRLVFDYLAKGVAQ